MKRPDIVIIEGLNVLQPARVREDGRTGLALSDFFDFSVYVDAGTGHIRRLVRRALPAAARDGVPRPGLLLRQVRRAHPRRGGRRGRADLGHHQRPQPRAEHPADPVPGHAGAAQGPRPLGALRAAPQALTFAARVDLPGAIVRLSDHAANALPIRSQTADFRVHFVRFVTNRGEHRRVRPIGANHGRRGRCPGCEAATTLTSPAEAAQSRRRRRRPRASAAPAPRRPAARRRRRPPRWRPRPSPARSARCPRGAAGSGRRRRARPPPRPRRRPGRRPRRRGTCRRR